VSLNLILWNLFRYVLKVGMDTHSAEDLQSGFVHLRDLGHSPTGVRKVAVDLSDGEETAIKLIQRGSQA
jgi:hypothetical protein